MEIEFELEEEVLVPGSVFGIDCQCELRVIVTEVKVNWFFSVLHYLVWKQKREWSSLVIDFFFWKFLNRMLSNEPYAMHKNYIFLTKYKQTVDV